MPPICVRAHVGQIRGHPPRQVERAAQDLGPSRVQTFGHHFGFEGKPLQPRSPAARGRASTRCATFTSPQVLRSSYASIPRPSPSSTTSRRSSNLNRCTPREHPHDLVTVHAAPPPGRGVRQPASARPVASVARGRPLVPSFVVAGHSRHQLLIVGVRNVGEERCGAGSTQRRGHLAVMSDHDVAVLAHNEREPLRTCHPTSIGHVQVHVRHRRHCDAADAGRRTRRSDGANMAPPDRREWTCCCVAQAAVARRRVPNSTRAPRPLRPAASAIIVPEEAPVCGSSPPSVPWPPSPPSLS